MTEQDETPVGISDLELLAGVYGCPVEFQPLFGRPYGYAARFYEGYFLTFPLSCDPRYYGEWRVWRCVARTGAVALVDAREVTGTERKRVLRLASLS